MKKTVRKGVVFRAYPTEKQKQQIHQTIGCCRKIWNICLEVRQAWYQLGEKSSYSRLCKLITELKRTQSFSYLNDVSICSLQQTLRDMEKGMKRFYNKQARFPKYKSKKTYKQSYREQCINNNIRVEGNKIKIPKLGWVKVKGIKGYDPNSIIHNATIKINKSGDYLIILNVDQEIDVSSNNENNKIGLDVGLKDYCCDSNGNKVSNPKFFEKTEKKLGKEHHRLDKKQYGSKNYEKQRLKLAKVYKKTVNQKKDFQHKLSLGIVKNNQIICAESLAVQELRESSNLSKSINSASWGRFLEMLNYKSDWYEKTFIRVDQYYPSSQICSECGYRNREVKNLSVREWECPMCHTYHDRDINAAKNILAKGLEMLENGLDE